MAGVANITIIGNLGRDPETRYTPGGTLNVQFSVAVSRRWNDQSGQQQERTTWYRVTGWGKLAEVMDSLSQQGALAKGRQVYVSGTLDPREYVDKDGVTRTSLDVRPVEFQLLGPRQDGPGNVGGPRGMDADAPSQGGPDDLDDVPF